MTNPSTTIKQVLVLRKDLNMRKGKMTAQGSHASMASIFGRDKARVQEHDNGTFTLSFTLTADEYHWFNVLSAKIVVGVNSEAELMDVYNQAVAMDLPVALIQDAGLTEFGGVKTYTAVGIGPVEAHLVDQITGSLTLL